MLLYGSKSNFLIVGLELDSIDPCCQDRSFVKDTGLLSLNDDQFVNSSIERLRPYPKSQPPNGNDKANSPHSQELPRVRDRFFIVVFHALTGSPLSRDELLTDPHHMDVALVVLIDRSARLAAVDQLGEGPAALLKLLPRHEDGLHTFTPSCTSRVNESMPSRSIINRSNVFRLCVIIQPCSLLVQTRPTRMQPLLSSL